MGYHEGKQAVLRLLRDRYETGGEKPHVTDEPLDADKYKNTFYLFVDFGDVRYPSAYTDDCRYWYKRDARLTLMFRGATTETLRERTERAAYDLVRCVRGFAREDIPCEVGGVEFYFNMTGTPNLTGAQAACVFDIPEEDEEGEYGDETV
jgi:hypothetical protein